MEAVLPSLARGVTSNLFSKSTIEYLFQWGLDSSLLTELRIVLNRVEALWSSAEERRHEEDPKVNQWLVEVISAIYDARDLQEVILADVPLPNQVHGRIVDSVENNDSIKEKMKFKFREISRAVRPSKKSRESEVIKLIQRLKLLADQKNDVLLKERVDEMIEYKRDMISASILDDTSKTYGRQEDKEKILKLLNCRDGQDDELRVVSIVGMGGVGKTTLARHVYNEQASNLTNMFDVKCWVCVSEKFDVEVVMKLLLNGMSGKAYESNTDPIASQLKKQLLNKRFLFVLDDTWSDDPLKWKLFKNSVAGGAPGSRIIVTTRSETVARVMQTNTDCVYNLNGLSEGHCWTLFREVAFPNGDSNLRPALVDKCKEAIRRCQGLPLAVVMLGGLLSKTHEVGWKDVLDSEVWDSKHKKILPTLWLSYYRLPLQVKLCFAYCSIYPKGYEFSKEELVRLWVAEGLIVIEEPEHGKHYEIVARTYFTHLCSTFFIQQNGSDKMMFTMHDLVHDLAEHVSKDICVNLNKLTLQPRRLSFMQCQNEGLLNSELLKKLRHLRTFLPLRTNVNNGDRFYLSNRVRELLSSFKLLRVLSLEGYEIIELPSSIRHMKLLRHLNLSKTYIEQLPESICDLYNLQTLILSNCYGFKRLPVNLPNLINLKHLDVEGTHLHEMPDGIGRMTSLQTLSNFVLGKGKLRGISQFKELKSLCGRLQVSQLSNVETRSDVVTANFGGKEDLEELILVWQGSKEREVALDKVVLDAMQPHKHLKRLTIKEYGGTRLPDWMGASHSLNNMVYLCINDCFRCQSLPPLGNLPFLEVLTINWLECLKALDEGFYGDSDAPFRSLEKLEIRGMRVLKSWSCPAGNKSGFPSLKKLTVYMCRVLTKIPYCFPSLVELSIQRCSELVKLEMCTCLVSPTPIGHSLQSILVEECARLIEIPMSFQSLMNFDVRECYQLVSVPSLQHVPKLSFRTVGVEFPIKAALQDCTQKLEEMEILGLVHVGELLSAKTPLLQSLASLKCLNIQWRDEILPPRRPMFQWKDDDELRDEKLTSLKRANLHWKCDDELISSLAVIRFPPNLSDLRFMGAHRRLRGDIYSNVWRGLCCLNYLTKLQLCGWKGIKSLPDDAILPSSLKCLSLLSLDDLKSFPNLSGCSKSLEELAIWSCPNLEPCPDVQLPSTLKRLHLDGWEALETFPDRFLSGCSNSLEELQIQMCCNLNSFSDDTTLPSTLKCLNIYGCTALINLPEYLLRGCSMSLEELTFNCCNLQSSSVSKLPSTLKKLVIGECHSLQTLPKGIFTTCRNSLVNIKIRDCSCLVSLPETISSLMSLQILTLHNCRCFEHFPGSGLPLRNLETLDIMGCTALKSLPDDFHTASCLQILSITSCSNLVVSKHGFPPTLRSLSLRCNKFRSVSKLKLPKLTSLTNLTLDGFSGVSTLDGCLPLSVEVLKILNFPHLKSISAVLSSLKQLRYRNVMDCPHLNARGQQIKH